MIQSVTYLLRKYEDLRWIPRTLFFKKGQSQWHVLAISELGRQRQADPWSRLVAQPI